MSSLNKKHAKRLRRKRILESRMKNTGTTRGRSPRVQVKPRERVAPVFDMRVERERKGFVHRAINQIKRIFI